MQQKLEINRLFSPHMVLQREKNIKIWGKCNGKEPVIISFMGHEVTAEIERNVWTVFLPPLKAARNQILTVKSGAEEIRITDIHVGEVWLAGGQSNMEFYMRYDADYQEAFAQCQNDDIRFYDVPEICYEGQEQDFDYSRMGFWRTCTQENLEYYSAVGYYFAEKIWRELQVPVGVIGCNKGGSCTQAWMSEDALKEHGEVWLEEFEKEKASVDYTAYRERMRTHPSMNMGNPFADAFTEETLYGIGVERQRELMELSAQAQAELPLIHYDNRPGCYYENMLKTISGAAIRGVIWYQGESEVFHPECYEGIFRDMVECWRKLWEEELPFYCVQLAPFQSWMDCLGVDFPVIRRIQQEAVRSMEKAYLISTSDVGMRYDIHPKKKKPVGQRLALSALKYQYKKDVQADAPVCCLAYTKDNDLYLEFEGDMDTLEVKGEEIRELQLFGQGFDREQELSFDRKDFAVEGRKLILRNVNAGGCRVSRVVFAGRDYYEVNLYGSNGIPAMPFECWPE